MADAVVNPEFVFAMRQEALRQAIIVQAEQNDLDNDPVIAKAQAYYNFLSAS